MYNQYLDMHLYEESEQGLNIWTTDALVYNMEKFKMDTKLINYDFDETTDHGRSKENKEARIEEIN